MRRSIILALLLVTSSLSAFAQAPADSILARGLVFRGIGPALMGGRITEIAVAERGRLGTVIYIAAATGGLWRSTNAGVSWTSLFDSVRAPSIGAVAVAPSNADVIWVGTGEPQNMRSSSWGNGVYKSIDGGRTWSAPMLPKSQHIGRIVIDPRDPNVVYVAAVGPLWAPGGERGLFKTSDGGNTWTNTKAISQFTGFTEVVMDPLNPDVLYAASYQRERRAYSFLPAGPETAIWKTTDGAKTWTKLTSGLPTGELGRIGLSVCRSRPSTVYAIVHSRGTTGGTFRSDDAGATWRQTNNVNSTAWFYGQIRCDPTDPDHVIRLAPSSQQSWDGGRTYVGFAAAGTHSD
ncbi:MAG TPA: sialidase family protein, partial [Gemmatimonadaceae bacterium]|nr:sialidase family protein [Gemmatimonadaceae bacterium]